MFSKIWQVIKKLWTKYKVYILYVTFGGLTTIVNYAIFIPLNSGLKVDALIANVVAWIGAVAFAYITNRLWVFKSNNKGFKRIMLEAFEFALGRGITLLIEELMLGIFVTWLGFNANIIKLIASVVTIILNYIFSKFIIFRKKESGEEKK